ncbi:MAG: hypothetical protein ACHQ16_01590, partial [Candidatus Lutacidiplasmatales archaeon]
MVRTASRQPRSTPVGAVFGLTSVILLLALSSLTSVEKTPGSPRAGTFGANLVGTAAGGDVPLGASPPPSAYGAMAFDNSTGSVILFGGMNLSGVAQATTWQYRNGNWTNLTPSLRESPPARWGASFAFDPLSGALVLFGGCQVANCEPAFADTWEFASGAWVDLTPQLNLSPPARGYAPMTYDAADGYLLLFGGLSASGASVIENDTWSFGGGAWHSRPALAGATTPSGRYDEMLQYDPVDHTTVLFGGIGVSADLGDTWTYRAGNWTAIGTPSSVAPGARHGAETCFDAADRYVFLLGGQLGGASLSDVWSFSGGIWSPLMVSGNPPAGYGGQMTYDAADGYVLWFSGRADSSSMYISTENYLHGSWGVVLTPQKGGASLGALIAPFLLILGFFVVLQGVFLVVERVRARREAQDGFAVPPGTAVFWIPSGPKATPGSSAGGVMVVTMIAVFLPIIVLISAGNGGAAGLFAVLILVAPILAVAIALAYISTNQRRIRSIGVSHLGVIVRRSNAELRLPWDYLHPSDSFYSPKAGWFNFRYATPKEPNRERMLPMTLEQARGVILSPYAPRWVLIPLASRLLGLPPSTPAPVPAPPPV